MPTQVLVEQGAAIFGSQAITVSIDAQWNEVTSSYESLFKRCFRKA